MALNQSKKKKLAAALEATSRSKLTTEDLEQAADMLIEGKSRAEVAEQYGVSPQTLAKRLRGLLEEEQPAV